MSNSHAASEKLTEFYCSFYRFAKQVAIAPYKSVYTWCGGYSLLGIDDLDTIKEEEGTNMPEITARLVCGALTLIPVLPALTLITMSLALIGLLLAALSSGITYPIANICDC